MHGQCPPIRRNLVAFLFETGLALARLSHWIATNLQLLNKEGPDVSKERKPRPGFALVVTNAAPAWRSRVCAPATVQATSNHETTAESDTHAVSAAPGPPP